MVRVFLVLVVLSEELADEDVRLLLEPGRVDDVRLPLGLDVGKTELDSGVVAGTEDPERLDPWLEDGLLEVWLKELDENDVSPPPGDEVVEDC